MSTQVEERETTAEGEPPADVEQPASTLAAGDITRAHLKGLIEAIVFASEHPVPVNDLAKAAGRADKKLVRSLVDELRLEYSRRGIQLEEVGGGLIFRTHAAYAPFVRDVAAKKPVRMTRAQLETLAIISYRQPLTRPEIDDIRGVDSGPVLKTLLDRDLIRILGKKDEPGRPLLYGTTTAFLEFFGLMALKVLPSLREFTELSDDSRRVFDREMAETSTGDETTMADVDALAAAASAVAPAHDGGAENAEPSSPATRPAEILQSDAPEADDPTESDSEPEY
jgi:segregation and condensation protein B